MKISAITIILSICIAVSQQNYLQVAHSMATNVPQAIEVLDLIEQKFKELRSELATQKKLLRKDNFQVAEAAASIAAISAGIGMVDEAITLYDKVFDKFFDTTAMKDANAYLIGNEKEMTKVDDENSLKSLQ